MSNHELGRGPLWLSILEPTHIVLDLQPSFFKVAFINPSNIICNVYIQCKVWRLGHYQNKGPVHEISFDHGSQILVIPWNESLYKQHCNTQEKEKESFQKVCTSKSG